MVLTTKEVVETDLVKRGRGGVGGDVTTNAHPGTLRPMHHHRCVPPDPGAVPSLGLLVTREPWLILGGNGVDVIGAGERRYPDAGLASPFEQPQHEVPGALLASG